MWHSASNNGTRIWIPNKQWIDYNTGYAAEDNEKPTAAVKHVRDRALFINPVSICKLRGITIR